ncbi:MAG: helix-turn-helix domain-containing protein [Alphaproteobacteria bacterium]
MSHPVDEFVGQRLRHRRWLVGMTQQQLGEAVGIKFQQIQKYESGVNRVSASRLWDISRALSVPVAFFFEGLQDAQACAGADHETINGNGKAANGLNGNHNANGDIEFTQGSEAGHNNGNHIPEGDVLANRETADLIRAYYTIPQTQRRRLLDLARAMGGAG